MRVWKKVGVVFLSAALTLGSGLIPTWAGDSESVRELETKTTGTTKEISVKEVEFDFYEEEEENLKIEFYTKVRYKKPTVAVKDENGKVYDTEILERDWDELELWVDGLTEDHTYTIVITGIKPRSADTYGTLSIEASTGRKVDKQEFYEDEITVSYSGMERGIEVERVELEWNEEKEDSISLDFLTNVNYKNLSVKVTDDTGKEYKATRKDWDEDDLELSMEGLVEGKSYKIVINGIRPKNTDTFGTLSVETSVKKQETPSQTGTKVSVKKAEYDPEDEELELKFNRRVLCDEKMSVTVTDVDGKKRTLPILETHKDEITLDTYGVELDEMTEITVSGVKAVGEEKYAEVTVKIRVEWD